MIPHLIRAAMHRPWVVVILAIVVMAVGVWAFKQQPIDAYPDISAQMVQVITVYPGRAPEEVERQVTIPVEIAMRNVPRVEVIRSRTIFGLSVVQMIFEEGTESYWARQRVQEKVASLELPTGAQAELGPLATAYGEVYRYELVSTAGHDLIELRTLNDWVVIPRLLRAPGVAEVSNFGGLAKQFAVTFQPRLLERFGLTLNDLVQAIQNNNASAGGSVLPRGSMSFVIRGSGSLEDQRQIENIFVKSVGGTPLYLKDVAEIGVDSQPPSGIYSKDWSEQSVEGICLMRRGENPTKVLANLNEAVAELNSTELPAGVKAVPFYDRQHLVDATLDTVSHSVLLGITLVFLVLLLFLGRPSMALLVAFTIPFSLLFALILMYLTKIPIGLLSIGAIDFGIIVDGAIIMAENIARRLGDASHRGARRGVFGDVLHAALEVERSVFLSIVMIVVAYVPLLSLGSIEGLLFRPMALTMVYALAGSLLFALFMVPVLATLLFRSGYQEWENPLLHLLRPLYARLLHGLLASRWIVMAVVVCILAFVAVRIAPRLGFEFLPYMDEGVIWVRANLPEGTSLQQTSAFGRRIREIALEFEDIRFISVQAGRNDSGTDPFPPSRMEIMVGPKPRSQWKHFATKQALVAALGKRLRDEFPTTRLNFTQPIIDSVTEDTNGTSANLAVEFSGVDSEVLLRFARQTVDLLKSIPGAQDVSIEQEGPQPQLLILPNRQLSARYNVRIEDVTTLINTALGGQPVGTLYEEERRFDIVVKLDRAAMSSPQAVERLPVHTADGVPVPLGQVAQINLVDGQTIIARENGRRRLTVRCDIVGRDQGSFVWDAQSKFDKEIRPGLPTGYRIAWLGMFENLQRAQTHFLVVMPITVALIFGLLLLTFFSLRSALLLLASVPFAFIGGVLALYFRGMNLNVSTGVGFAALFGVSIMNGVLMVRSITAVRHTGLSLGEAIIQGAQECLRPILLASLVAILGLLPASLAAGLGSDVQRPLATVIVWGLFSSTILTLLVIPVAYRLFPPGLLAVQPREAAVEARFIEPLPDVSATDVIGLVEYLHQRGDQAKIVRIADETHREFGRIVSMVKAAEMLDLVETPQDMAALTAKGKRLVEATPEERKTLWREQILTLGLFREIHDVLRQQESRAVDSDFVLETIVTRMPYENHDRIFNTFVRWARFGELFAYDETKQQITLLRSRRVPREVRMSIFWNVVRVGIAAVIVVAVAELSKRHPRFGALLLSLPLVSILAFLLSWFQHGDLPAISKLARETLILVPLGLPFFVPLAFATRLGLDFWASLAAGLVLASLTIGSWLLLGPRS